MLVYRWYYWKDRDGDLEIYQIPQNLTLNINKIYFFFKFKTFKKQSVLEGSLFFYLLV